MYDGYLTTELICRVYNEETPQCFAYTKSEKHFSVHIRDLKIQENVATPLKPKNHSINNEINM